MLLWENLLFENLNQSKEHHNLINKKQVLTNIVKILQDDHTQSESITVS